MMTRVSHALFFATVAILIASLNLSCKTTGGGDGDDDTIPPTPDGSAGAGSVSAIGFLSGGGPQLNQWLDARFEVKYMAMTPQKVFNMQPLDDIKYELVNLPEEAAPFNYESGNISRREVLKKVSDFWNLDMTFVVGADGMPTAIRVSG